MFQKKGWKPDPEVVKRLEELGEHGPPCVIEINGRGVLSWSQVIEDVIQGTGFGKSFHNSFRGSIRDPRRVA
jgi:hypothetical protein